MANIERGVTIILKALGEDITREGIKDTPKRVAKLYADILDSQYTTIDIPTTFTQETYHGIVMVHHIPFYAFCEHHLLPFIGHFAVGYIPDKKLVGLSKLVRMFRYWTKRVTIQERLAEQAVDTMMEQLEPHGAIVYISAEHTCMSLRGVKSPGAKTTTITSRGVFLSDLELRSQFISEASK